MSNPHRGPVPILRAAPAGPAEDTLRQLALLVDMAKQAGKLREDWLADPEALPTIRIRAPFLDGKGDVLWATATYDGDQTQWSITLDPTPIGRELATVPIHHVVFVLAQAEQEIEALRKMSRPLSDPAWVVKPMPVRTIGER